MGIVFFAKDQTQWSGFVCFGGGLAALGLFFMFKRRRKRKERQERNRFYNSKGQLRGTLTVYGGGTKKVQRPLASIV